MLQIKPEDLDDLLGVGPLDRALAFTRFEDYQAETKRDRELSLRQLADRVGRQLAPIKAALPWIKLARFGDDRLPPSHTGLQGCLRHNANMVAITGVEGDYDAGAVTPAEAVERLHRWGIAALVYTSPSHTPEAPRWRVLAPLSREHPPEDRADLVARLNGALGGILAPESFAASQSYYFGRLQDAEGFESYLVEGAALDRIPSLPAARPEARTSTAEPLDDLRLILKRHKAEQSFGEDVASGRLASALKALSERPVDSTYRGDWSTVVQALCHATGGSVEAFEIWRAWAEASPRGKRWARDGKAGVLKRQARADWNRYTRRGEHGNPVTLGSLYELAKAAGWTWRSSGNTPARDTSGFAMLTPAECETAPERGYIIKGLLAPHDVGMIFGQPGAGKSLLGPFLGYMIALEPPRAADVPAPENAGRVFDRLTRREGPVFYVANEDPHGMRGRVKALRRQHGDAPDFLLLTGLNDLMPDSAHLVKLQELVEERKPSLVFVDTVAASFPPRPGMEAESEAHFSAVRDVARSLAAGGAAVVLIHHPPKAGSTPRGSGILNGDLDVSILIERDGAGLVRAELPKNRNGSPFVDLAFRIEVEDGGTDVDGDRITLPRCAPLPPGDMAFRDLTPTEAKALDVLRGLIAEARQRDHTQSSVTEDIWKVACIGPGVVSTAESAESRERMFRKARTGLAEKGRTMTESGAVRATSIDSNGLPDGGL